MNPALGRILFAIILGALAPGLALAQAGQTVDEPVSARQRPIENVANYPFGNQKALTLQAVSQAIVRAGARRGWSVVQVRPGVLVATLNIRSHQAVVDIVHTTTVFSITYKSSVNLQYNASRQLIHRNYNSWITNLRGDIMSEVSIL